MLGALIIVLRESVEAGLIVGVVLAATRGVPRRGRWVALGVGAGILGACVVAAFAGNLAELFHGSGQELFNATVLFAAVGMLAWHNIWMAKHGREMARDARKLGEEIAHGSRSLAAAAGVVAVAVLREGSEVVLFLYGLVTSEAGHLGPVISGGFLGLFAGAAVSALIYFGLVAIPMRHFFSATATLITLLAAGLAAQAVSFLQQGGYSDLWSTPMWDTSGLLPEAGWVGKALHTLVGYTDQPTGMQLLAYALTLAGILAVTRVVRAQPVTAKP